MKSYYLIYIVYHVFRSAYREFLAPVVSVLARIIHECFAHSLDGYQSTSATVRSGKPECSLDKALRSLPRANDCATCAKCARIAGTPPNESGELDAATEGIT